MLVGTLLLALCKVWFILWARCCPKNREQHCHHRQWRLLWPVALAEPSHISAGCLWEQLISSGMSAVLEGEERKKERNQEESNLRAEYKGLLICCLLGKSLRGEYLHFFLLWFNGWFLSHCEINRSGINPVSRHPSTSPVQKAHQGLRSSRYFCGHWVLKLSEEMFFWQITLPSSALLWGQREIIEAINGLGWKGP